MGTWYFKTANILRKTVQKSVAFPSTPKTSPQRALCTRERVWPSLLVGWLPAHAECPLSQRRSM